MTESFREWGNGHGVNLTRGRHPHSTALPFHYIYGNAYLFSSAEPCLVAPLVLSPSLGVKHCERFYNFFLNDNNYTHLNFFYFFITIYILN